MGNELRIPEKRNHRNSYDLKLQEIADLLPNLKKSNYDKKDINDLTERILSRNEAIVNKEIFNNKIRNSILNHKEKFVKKGLNDLYKHSTRYDEKSDVIDFHIGTFSQGQQGDCFLLAAIDTMSDKDLRETIFPQKNGSFNVVFKGVRTPINIKKDELEEAFKSSKNAKGDKDVTLLELAFEKSKLAVMRGGDPALAAGYLTNIPYKHILFTSDKDIENINMKNQLSTCYLRGTQLSNTRKENLQIGNTEFEYNHIYSVRRFDKAKGVIIVADPHNNSVEIEIAKNDFKKHFGLTQEGTSFTTDGLAFLANAIWQKFGK